MLVSVACSFVAVRIIVKLARVGAKMWSSMNDTLNGENEQND